MKRMKQTILTALMLSLLVNWSEAQTPTTPSGGYTLAQCVEYARVNNPNIKIARVNEQISESQTQQVIGRNLPQVSVSGSVLDNVKIPVQLLPGELAGQPSGTFIPIQFGTQYNTTLTGRVDQKLFDPSFGLALKAAKIQTQVQAQATLQAEQTQAYNIATAYYQTLVIDLQRRLTIRDLTSSDTLLQQEKVRLQNGTTREIDFGRIQLNRNNLQSQLEQIARNYEQAINRLKFQMGMPLSETLTIQPLEVEKELHVNEKSEAKRS